MNLTTLEIFYLHPELNVSNSKRWAAHEYRLWNSNEVSPCQQTSACCQVSSLLWH